jgi:multidrug efflux system membrane fusion protein
MLKAHFPNPQHRLWPGQSVDARIVLGERAQMLTVPAPVVQRGQEGMFAYVIDADGKARIQPVQIDADASDTRIAVITQGLSAGERVVSDGQYRLTPGARIVESQAGQNGKDRRGDKGAADKGAADKGTAKGAAP